MVTHLDGRDPAAVLEAADPSETIVADPTVERTVSESLTVTTPGLTLRGFNLRLAPDANANLVEIGADGVCIEDFRLDGTRVDDGDDRHSNGVLVTGATNVTVRDGVIANTTRHGIRIADTGTITSRSEGNVVGVPRGEPTADVLVRDVRVESPRRDGCSVEGPDVENVRVEGVRTYGSLDRGGVEVKDGARNALVSNCYAADCVYGVALQDHGGYSASNVRFVGNAAERCETAVDTQTSHDLPPQQVAYVGNVGRELGGDGMGGPGGIYAHRIEGLHVAGNRLEEVAGPGIVLERCRDASIRANAVRAVTGDGIAIRDSSTTGITENVVDAGFAAIDCSAPEKSVSWIQLSDNQCRGGSSSLRIAGAVDSYLVATNLLADGLVDNADGDGVVAHNLR